MLKSLDSVLNAVDPINIAKRRQAMAEADYQQKYGIPLRIAQGEFQMKMLPLQYEYFRKHGYFPPTTPQGAMAAENYENMRTRGDNFDSYKHPDGNNPYTQAPQPKTTILHPPAPWNPADISVTPTLEQPTVPLEEPVVSPPPTTESEQPPPALGPTLAQTEPLQGISSSDEEEDEIA